MSVPLLRGLGGYTRRVRSRAPIGKQKEIKVYLPGIESFGFSSQLRAAKKSGTPLYKIKAPITNPLQEYQYSYRGSGATVGYHN